MSISRDLSIKKGALTRLTKELSSYADEARTTAEKVSAMRAAGEEPHDVKHAVRRGERREESRVFESFGDIDGRRRTSEDDRSRVVVIYFFFLNLFSTSKLQNQRQENIAAESALMVPDTRQRLAAVVADTRKLLVSENG
jgi:hypothetical protein